MATNENLKTAPGLVAAPPRLTLCDDIFFYVARNFLEDARDVFALAATSQDLWRILQTEIYRIDILQAKFYIHQKRECEHPEHSDRRCTCEIDYEADKLEYYLTFVNVRRGFNGKYPICVASHPPGDPPPPPPQNQTILQWAAATGTLPTVKKALEVAEYTWRDYIDLENPFHWHSAVHMAAMFGHAEVLRALANAGCSMNHVLRIGRTARSLLNEVLCIRFPEMLHSRCWSRSYVTNTLGIALLTQNEESAKILVEYHDEQRAREQRRMFHPLAIAAMTGMVNMVRKLIQKGAEVNYSSRYDNSTPLMWAAYRVGNRDMVHALHKLGANLESRDSLNQTSVFWAASRLGNEDMIDALHELGANLAWRDTASRNALYRAIEVPAPQNAYRLIERGVSFDSGSPKSCSLLQCMLDDRLLDCTQLMLAEPSNLSKELLSYCFRKAIRQNEVHNLRTIRYFIEHDIGLEVEKDQHGRVLTTALHQARWLPLDLLELLLEKRKCDINTKDWASVTAACRFICHPGWNKSKAALLFKHGADPSACETWRERVVMRTIKDGGTEEDVQETLNKYDGLWPTLFE